MSIVGIKIAVEVIKVLAMAVDVADRIVDVMHKAGYLKNTNNTEDLGAKSLWGQEQDIRPENYESYDEYLNELDELTLTDEQDGKFSSKQKTEAGSKIIENYMNERYGTKSEDFLLEAAKHKDFYKMNGRVEAYLDVVGNRQIAIEDIGKYFDNKLDNLETIKKVDSALTEAEIKLGVDNKEAEKILDDEMKGRND